MENPIKVRQRQIEVEAIQWINNEPFIRAFIKDDTLLKFPDGGTLKIWNIEEDCWVDCPMYHYIIKGIKGEFYPCSPEVFNRSYDIVT